MVQITLFRPIYPDNKLWHKEIVQGTMKGESNGEQKGTLENNIWARIGLEFSQLNENVENRKHLQQNLRKLPAKSFVVLNDTANDK